MESAQRGHRKRSRFSSVDFNPLVVDVNPPASVSAQPSSNQLTNVCISADQSSEPPIVLSSFKRGKSLKRRQLALNHFASSPKSNKNHHSLNSTGLSLFATDDDFDDQTQKSPVKNVHERTAEKKRKIFLPSSATTDNQGFSFNPEHKPLMQSMQSSDPLDSFMDTISGHQQLKTQRNQSNQDLNSDDSDFSAAEEERSFKASQTQKRKLYQKIDHSNIDYPDFQKNLYIEVPELQKMTHAEVAVQRRKLGNIRIRGKRCPRPILSWAQCGLSASILLILGKYKFSTPTPIQAQAIPCIMSGRDVIGIARTGSGKTLAFLLPIFRHVALQRRASPGEGPSALIIAPTRELAIQIYGDARKFAKAVGIRCVCAYGGSGVKDQIADLKRGPDLIVCTPGRMIDLLAMNGGRITNLLRVTFVVLDEADRMFDMGFEPQLARIVENVRPDRQTVMFSATFPIQVEKLARKVLRQPVEIMVGGNSVAAATIDQHIEVRSEESKFFRLLELLGVWYDKGSTLIFVDRQDNADRIFRDLSKARYKCLSLHGGMDQADRDSTIVDFKNGDVKVLVATSVAARGLDVKNLVLVVNYDVPSHYEDYVHRVGRTGRAGNRGTAYTFITPEQDAYAGELAKALCRSARASAEQEAPIGDEDAAKKAGDEAVASAVPAKLRELVDSFQRKRKAGIVKYRASSGYGGRGFRFEENEDYDVAKAALRTMQARQYGLEDDTFEEAPEGGQAGKGGSTSMLGNASIDDDDGDDGDDDGIVAISTSVSANGYLKENVRMLNRPQIASIPDRPLSTEEIETLLADAVEQAEQSAESKRLNQIGRRALVAKAKANVLSVVSMRNRTTTAQRRASGSAGLRGNLPEAQTTNNDYVHNSGNPVVSNLKTREDPEIVEPRSVSNSEPRFACELEINDYPQHARWQVTRKNSLNDVEEFTGCVITTRGNYYPAGRNPPHGKRRLHFLIEGPTRRAVKMARRDIRQKLAEASEVYRPSDNLYSKYSVKGGVVSIRKPFYLDISI